MPLQLQNNDCISDSKRMKNTVAIYSSIIAEACTQQLYENSMDSTANRIGAETSTVKNLNGFFASKFMLLQRIFRRY